MRLPTASSLWLADLCPASHTQPRTVMVSESMVHGKEVHRYLERLPEVGRARALAEVPPEHRDVCERIDPAQVPQGLREAAYAWNVDTGEVLHLGNGIGRDYTAALRRKLEERDGHQGKDRRSGVTKPGCTGGAGAPGDRCDAYAERGAGSRGCPDQAPARQHHDHADQGGVTADLRSRWIFGTADVVEVDGPAPAVSDYKVTDVPIDARGLLKPAAQSHQLRFLALAVARMTGADAVEVAHLRVGSDGRIDGSDRAGLSYFDLAQVEEEVRGIVARVERAAAQAQPDLNPGEHCRWCPAAQRCPSTRTLIGQLIEDLDMAPLPVIADAVAWLWVKQARGALDLLDQELRRRAALAPIRLPDGREVREVDVEQRSLDPRVAHDVMRDAYGRGKAWEAMETSRAALQRAIGGGGAGLRSVLKEIEARGGVQLTTVRRVVEVAPEPGGRPGVLATTWPEDMDPEDFTALHVGPARSES